MAKLNLEYFLARRIATSHGSDSKNVMVRIATLTIALGVAAMVLSLAVVSGFKSEITQKLVGFGSHVQIINRDGNSSLETSPIMRDSLLETEIGSLKDFKSLHTFAVKGGVLKTDQATQGVMLKGVDEGFDWSFFEKNMVTGTLPRVGDSIRNKDIIIAKSLSELMRIGIDDRVEMLFVQSDSPPRRDRFRVVGIYNSGMDELDKMIILTDIRNVQRLSNWTPNQVTGYEVAAQDISSIDDLYGQIEQLLNQESFRYSNLLPLSLSERYANLYDWLKTHDVNAMVIITIILIVALLNMISAMLIILLERTSMVGILKAIGMKNRPLQKMFAIRSSFIVIKGMVWGNLVAIGLGLLQQWTHAVKLNEAGYFLSHVPIHFDWWSLAGLNLATFAIIVLLLTIPTIIISSVKPEKTIRYQ